MIKYTIVWLDQTKGEKETKTMEGKLSLKKKMEDGRKDFMEYTILIKVVA